MVKILGLLLRRSEEARAAQHFSFTYTSERTIRIYKMPSILQKGIFPSPFFDGAQMTLSVERDKIINK